ncbi:hypothetical protein ACJBWN_11810, partial [Streptococcus suis]
VRDRELRAWVAAHGMGLPLYLAEMERRIRDEVRKGFERERGIIRAEINAHQPVWSRLRRLRRGIRRLRG